MLRYVRSSLRVRLALWYLAVLGAALILFGVTIFVYVDQSLHSSLDAVLTARADTVANQVQIVRGRIVYPPDNDAPRAETEVAVYLFDAGRHLSDRVAGSTALPPRADLLGRTLQGEDRFATLNGVRLYMVSVRDDQHIVGVVQVIESLSAVDAELSHLLELLVIVTPALLAAAMAGGIFLAGRALAPIDRIARTAQAISAGNLKGRLGLAPRYDEVGRLAATFDSMLERLERAFAQQRQFVADASHELRTPLTIIKGDLDVLLRRRRSLDEYVDAAQSIDDEVTRLSRLVDDLLTLARADRGQVELSQELVDLTSIVDDVAIGMGRLAEAKGVILVGHLQPDVATIGDPDRVRQLITNVLANAVAYTLAGGQISVTLRVRGGDARIEVADTGIGIAPDDLPHVFDRFFRADRARARVAGGTGLGLAIALWCAEIHGGTIAVQSRLGQGSTFVITLPLAVTDAAPVAPESAQRSGAGRVS